jgi:hypothetical protein
MKFVLALFVLVCAALGGAQGYMGAQKADPNDAKQLKALEKSYVASKAAYKKKPKDAKLKKAYVAATVKYGHESMMSTSLDRSLKYRQALRLYREALKLDPENPVAKPESELIIRIYKSLGKPVPKD